MWSQTIWESWGKMLEENSVTTKSKSWKLETASTVLSWPLKEWSYVLSIEISLLSFLIFWPSQVMSLSFVYLSWLDLAFKNLKSEWSVPSRALFSNVYFNPRFKCSYYHSSNGMRTLTTLLYTFTTVWPPVPDILKIHFSQITNPQCNQQSFVQSNHIVDQFNYSNMPYNCLKILKHTQRQILGYATGPTTSFELKRTQWGSGAGFAQRAKRTQ